MSRYAIEHTDTAGVTHRWTCSDLSAHWVARWLALDSGQAVTVLTHIAGAWHPVTVWYPTGQPDPTYGHLTDPDDRTAYELHGYVDLDDPDEPDWQDTPWYKPITDYAAL